MKRTLSGLLLLGAALGAVPAAAQPALPPALIQSCEACHGKGGDSQRADVPRLNGQQKEYLLTRLREFLDPTRSTPHAIQMMWQNATRVSGGEAQALADYFSRQMPTGRNGFGPLAETGGGIYRQGATPDIPACSVCHGRDAEGLGETPRLAGQHEGYLAAQLNAFMLTARVGSPMNHHAWDMTKDQMDAIAAYLSHN
jgi:cytochrome c553